MNNAIKPDHYRKGRQYQPWDVAKDWDLDFDLGSVLKYIGRCGRKAGNSKIQDLKKAAEFLKHEIDCLEADEPSGICLERFKRSDYKGLRRQRKSKELYKSTVIIRESTFNGALFIFA